MCGNKDLNPYFKGPVATGLGATEILIGAFSIGFGIWGLLVRTSFFYIFYPVWCGVLALVGGSLAAATASRPAKVMINTTLGLSVVSLVAGLCQTAFATLSFLDIQRIQETTVTDFCLNDTNPDFNYTACNINQTVDYYLCTNWVNGYICTLEEDVNTGYNISLACLAAGAVQFAIALAAAIICCSCCMKTDSANKVFPLSTAANGTGGMGPERMVIKTIQADIRPATIRAKSMCIQTEGSFHSQASIKHVKPMVQSSSQTVQTIPQAQQQQQPPPIYILPMPGGQSYPQQLQPHHHPYYTTDPHPRSLPPNRDWVRDSIQYADTPKKRSESDKHIADVKHQDVSHRPPPKSPDSRQAYPYTSELKYVVAELAEEWLHRARKKGGPYQ